MTAPTLTPPTTRTERAVLADALRHARAAGWVFLAYGGRLGLPNGRGGWTITLDWEPGVDGYPGLLSVSLPHPHGGEQTTHIAVYTVQQAVDVAAALTGHGHHLTTGALCAWSIASRDLDALRAEAVAA